MASSRQNGRRWGWVGARPSEYLIKLRSGRIVKHGPGLSVWLWPGQRCAILPTTIQRCAFVADQVTAEKVGVSVSGLAVYRIAEPLIAFRMLDLGEATGGLDQLSAIMRDMFVGAARRLVATMTVEQCLTRRKEAIAAELAREIQPVVGGEGRPEDTTDRGWGLVIDTIEIQDVRILSEKVFADLQAPYRAELELQARQAEVLRDEQLHLRQVAAARDGLEADLELQRRRTAAEEQSKLGAIAAAQRLREAELESQQQTAELARREAAQRAELEALAAEARHRLEQSEAAHAGQVRRLALETDRLAGELKLALAQRQREIDNQIPEARVQHDFVRHALPAMAEALGTAIGPVQLTQISGGEKGWGFVAQLLGQLLAVGRAVGVDAWPGTAPTPDPQIEQA